jgi:SnoaL-like domain
MKLSIYIIRDPSLFTNEQEKYFLFSEFAARHVEKWVKGWTDHNLNAIMSSYAEELEFSSPKIRAVLGDKKNNTLSSKRELSTYFSAGLERFPNLKFKIIDFTVSDNKVILEYSANLDGKSFVIVIEKLEFENELVKKSGAYYGVEQTTD